MKINVEKYEFLFGVIFLNRGREKTVDVKKKG